MRFVDSGNRADLRPKVIAGGRCLIGGAFEEAVLVIADGCIVDIRAEEGSPDPGALTLNARGLHVAPAIVDVHGDAFERQVMPRPNVTVPLDVAFLETDRQLAANGIATTYHALTMSWEPGLRSIEQARETIHALDRLAPILTVENRVQLRWETFALEALDLVAEALAGPLTPSIAFNDHTSMMMLDRSIRIQDRPFEQRPDFPALAPDDPRLVDLLAGQSRRAGLSAEDYAARIGEVWARRPKVPEAIAEIARLGRAAGTPMLSHDDTTAEARAYYRGLGARVAEFPMSLDAARDARAHGDTVIFGAPNAMRGGSHIGSLAAGAMVEDGLCDALASDYYYPAMRAAVARLEDEKRADRATLWALVSDGPARAMGLVDRGRIASGLRADIVVLDWPEGEVPQVCATLSAGRIAHLAEPGSGMSLLSQGPWS
ncbi:MAG: alpha-D-ribose 1-methylphosphonate 5-triphosphate diphosphatase [Rhodobiaceae bacterium]|nr:alpha-D-ribose 1-methylphosphonate 5-triphosphate diphosphatase [Rhodobiaceae bacterium]